MLHNFSWTETQMLYPSNKLYLHMLYSALQCAILFYCWLEFVNLTRGGQALQRQVVWKSFAQSHRDAFEILVNNQRLPDLTNMLSWLLWKMVDKTS